MSGTSKKMKYDNQLVIVKSPDDEDSRPFVWKCLDEIGKRVEKLREEAVKLEDEKAVLLSMLQEIQDKNNHTKTELEG
jgi:hypothetical protein